MSQDVDVLLKVRGVSKKFVGDMTIKQRTWNHICWVHKPDEDIIYSGDKVFNIKADNEENEDNVIFSMKKDVLESALIMGQSPNRIREGFSIRKMFQGYLAELNIWDQEISKTEIYKMRNCESFPRGNIVQWDRTKLRIVGQEPNIGIRNIDDRNFFCKKHAFFVIPQDNLLKFAYKQCQAFGGHIAVPKNDAQNAELLDLVKKFPACLDNPNSVAWIGIEKKAHASHWNMVNGNYHRTVLKNASDYTKIKEKVLSSIQTNEDYCVTLKQNGEWNIYKDCYSVTNSIVACNVCQFEGGLPSFSLKGSCKYNGPNWNYYLTQDTSHNNPGYYFEGYKRDHIKQDSEGAWHLYRKSGQSTLTLQPYTEGPAGRHYWIYGENEKQRCYEDKDQSIFTLTTCSFLNDFTCSDGACINKYKRCDDTPDCDDESDEENCTVVKLDPDYRPGEPPKLPNNEINYLKTSINVRRIDNIQLDGTMTMTMDIIIEWKDPKLTFLNIRDDATSEGDNIKEVSKSKQSQLWLPLDKIVHENAVIGDIEKGDNSYVRVIAKGSALDRDAEAHTEGRLYDSFSRVIKLTFLRCLVRWGRQFLENGKGLQN